MIQFNQQQQIVLILSFLKVPFTFECISFPMGERGSEVSGCILDLDEKLVINPAGLPLLPIETEAEWSIKVGELLTPDSDVSFSRVHVRPVPQEEGSETIRVRSAQVSHVEQLDLDAMRAKQSRLDRSTR